VGATWGVTSLNWAGVIQAHDYLFRWWTWWVGNSIGVITFTPLVLILAAGPTAASLWRKISVCVPLSLAFALIVVFFVYAKTWERDRARLEFKRRTDQLTHQLGENFDHYIGVLRALEAFYTSSDGISRKEFHSFVSRWFTQHQGIRTLSWNPRVLDSERATYEQAARKDGLTNYQILDWGPQGQLIRAGRRAEYFPVYYFESRWPVARSLGFDLALDPVRREALDRARDTGKPTATDQITRIRDTSGEASFLVFLPIYRSRADQNVAERRRNLQGYVTGAFRIREIINDVLTNADANDINLRLLNLGRKGEKGPRSAGRLQDAMLKGGPISAHLEYGGAFVRTVSFEFAERQWILRFSPTSAYFIAQRRWQAWSVLAAGLLFTGLLSSFLLAVTGPTNKLQAINEDLQREIAERQTSQNELAKYAVIVDSLDEAIIGSTWEGIVTTWNKAA
jgi:CHASE1-domain containing sensor protein